MCAGYTCFNIPSLNWNFYFGYSLSTVFSLNVFNLYHLFLRGGRGWFMIPFLIIQLILNFYLHLNFSISYIPMSLLLLQRIEETNKNLVRIGISMKIIIRKKEVLEDVVYENFITVVWSTTWTQTFTYAEDPWVEYSLDLFMIYTIFLHLF